MTWTPHATVATIIEQDEKFLLVQETKKGQTVLNQPAGHIEENESIFDAALRETLEETGYRVELTGFLGVYTYKPVGSKDTYFRFCFIAKVLEKTDQPLDADIDQIHWLTLDQLNSNAWTMRSPLVLRCINDYKKGVCYPLETITEYHLS